MRHSGNLITDHWLLHAWVSILFSLHYNYIIAHALLEMSQTYRGSDLVQLTQWPPWR